MHPAGEHGADPVGEIYVVGVDPDAQGLGLGRALTALGLDHLAGRGLGAAILYTGAENTVAVHTYERAGFVRVGRGRDVRFGYPEFTSGCHDGRMTDATALDPALAAHIAEHMAQSDDRRAHRHRRAAARRTGSSTASCRWLAFNQRVLELAEDADIPLLERVRFLAIFASNLDEFFMVRVAGLKRRIATGIAVTAASGLSPRQVLEAISEEAHKLMARHAAVFAEQVQPALAHEGITLVRWDELGESEQDRLRKFFRRQIFPVLTPLAVDPAHPFPYISGLSLNLAVVVTNPATGKEHFARVKVPPLLPRFIAVDASGRPSAPDVQAASPEKGPMSFVPVEDVISEHLEQLFPGMVVQEHHTFRVTRNEDVEVEEDDAENLLKAMEKELLRRRFGPPVRLEIADGISPRIRNLLIRELDVAEDEVYQLPAPLDRDRPQPHRGPRPRGPAVPAVRRRPPPASWPRWRARRPRTCSPRSASATSCCTTRTTRSRPRVQTFLQQAAADPQVLAIKQTLYRTSGDSPIVDALIDAAEAGKQVLALVEIKARFDEQNNISWARKLEQAGRARRLRDRRPQDALQAVAGGAPGVRRAAPLLPHRHRQLQPEDRAAVHRPRAAHQRPGGRPGPDAAVQPAVGLRAEVPVPPAARRARAPCAPGSSSASTARPTPPRMGQPAWIKIKVNSMVDEATIDALYRASQAGVPVDMVVRGICALRPGRPGPVRDHPGALDPRPVPRALAHLRVRERRRRRADAPFEGPEVYIGSADLMHRNLDRRVEALVRIADPDQVSELIELMDESTDDGTSSWHLEPDGTWQRHHLGPDGPLVDLQAALIYRQRRRPGTGR